MSQTVANIRLQQKPQQRKQQLIKTESIQKFVGSWKLKRRQKNSILN